MVVVASIGNARKSLPENFRHLSDLAREREKKKNFIRKNKKIKMISGA
jgi:hypothetical protein